MPFSEKLKQKRKQFFSGADFANSFKSVLGLKSNTKTFKWLIADWVYVPLLKWFLPLLCLGQKQSSGALFKFKSKPWLRPFVNTSPGFMPHTKFIKSRKVELDNNSLRPCNCCSVRVDLTVMWVCLQVIASVMCNAFVDFTLTVIIILFRPRYYVSGKEFFSCIPQID